MDKTILMIEDDIVLGQTLKDFFENNELTVYWAKHGKQGLELCKEIKPKLVLLDIVLPDMNGFEIAREIQKQNSVLPIIFMTGTALETEDYNTAYQNIRAKNYLEKPINPHKALAQINSLISHISEINYITNKTKIKIETQELTINDKKFLLREKEAQVFSVLLSNLNKTVNRKEIMMKVWNDDSSYINHSLNTAITGIRKKIKSYESISLRTVYGGGYQLKIT